MDIGHEKYLFLYLNTGNGHREPARILKNEIEKNPKIKVVLVNGFARFQFVARFFFEKGYHTTTAIMPSAYSAFYDMMNIQFFLNICKFFCTFITKRYIAHLLKKEKFTKVVSFHFAVSPAAYYAIKKINPQIPFIVDITDPFTAHKAWFLVPNAQFIVHSEQLKNEMIFSHKIKSEKIHVFPFIIDNKFSEITPQKIDKIKKDIDILPNQKVILIAGGGEGLSGVVKIVRSFVQLKDEKTNDVVLIVVCGRNFTSFKIIDKIIKKHKNKQIKLYGFVNNMDSLINIADCVITKGGASMLMQVSACCKPVIFSTYIHGQEKGNVDFAIQNKTGWFIRKAEKVIDKALQVCFDEKLKSEIKSKLKSINIKSDVSGLATKIIDIK